MSSDRPPPGFGTAAARAGLRPPRKDFGVVGTKSATRTSTIVNVETETDDGNLEVLQQSQMQGEAMASQSSCQTKSSLAGNKNASPAKGRPCKKAKDLRKHDKLEDNQGATDLRRLQTPINLFEDECAFCHSFRTSEKFHGPMVLYREGRIVSSNEGNPTNAIYVHKKCMDWAPRVYLEGDIYVNVEKEISRASRLKCSRCRLPGAALGCYHSPCAKTYHVPCAVMIPECSWDIKNHHVWCPKHASDPLPCHGKSSPIKESNAPSPILRNQCVDKEGISTNCRSEEKQTNRTRTPVNQWVLLGSVLSASEKDSLKEFASLTRSTLAEEWDKNVSHIIVGRSAGNACGASYDVLMAILSGKWVVSAGWIVDSLAKPIPGPKNCLAELIPGPENSYEVKFFNGFRTSIDGPNKGRAGAAEGAPKLFLGLYFCLSAYMNPEIRENIKNLVVAAEGKILESMSQRSLQVNLDKNPGKAYFIYVGDAPIDKEIDAIKYVTSRAQVISHLWLFDAIASYDARMLECSERLILDMHAKTEC